MNEFEKKQQEIKDLQAPPQLEDRLREALARQPLKPQKKQPIVWITVVAAALILLVFSYNYAAFAYYGEKFFGYEDLMTSSIQALNEEGYGQAINQSITLPDGAVLTVEGIMADTNGVHLFYKFDVVEDSFDFFEFPELTGFLTKAHMDSGIYNEESNRGIGNFEKVNAFSKKLTLSFTYKEKEYEMEFPYQANKAISTSLKKSINKSFTYDYGVVEFKKIIATKASTVIKAKLKEETDRSVRTDFMQVKLLADGEEIEMLRSGMSSTWYDTYDVELLLEAIPTDTKQLELVIEKFNGYAKLNASIDLQPSSYKVGDKWIEIIDIKQEANQTLVTIASEYEVLFDEVSLQTKGSEVELKGTGDFNDRTEKWIRTLYFDTTDTPQTLKIGGMYYMREYNTRIPIELD